MSPRFREQSLEILLFDDYGADQIDLLSGGIGNDWFLANINGSGAEDIVLSSSGKVRSDV